jgi:hypothetical protein
LGDFPTGPKHLIVVTPLARYKLKGETGHVGLSQSSLECICISAKPGIKYDPDPSMSFEFSGMVISFDKPISMILFPLTKTVWFLTIFSSVIGTRLTF